MAVSFAFAQRGYVIKDASKLDSNTEFFKSDGESDEEIEILYPGNSEGEDSGFYLDGWYDDEDEFLGWFFGTNWYKDNAYGQIFENNISMEIHGAIYWIGSRNGEEGNVIFTLWEYSEEGVGDVLASKTIAMADINPSTDFQDALVIEFDEPIVVSSDFFIGVDISDLGEWEDEVYDLGNVFSFPGTGRPIALVKEDDGEWVPVLEYGADVDISIFPLVIKKDEVSVPKTALDNTSINLYPNPARDRVVIRSEEKIKEVRIIDLSGRTVLQQTAGAVETSLITSGLKEGLYLVNVYTESGITSVKLQLHR